MGFSLSKKLFAFSLLGLATMPAGAQMQSTTAQDAVTEFNYCVKPLKRMGWRNDSNGQNGQVSIASFTDNNETLRVFHGNFHKEVNGTTYGVSAVYNLGDARAGLPYKTYFHISAYTADDVSTRRATDAEFNKVMYEYTDVRNACEKSGENAPTCITQNIADKGYALGGDDPNTMFHLSNNKRYWVTLDDDGGRVITTYSHTFKTLSPSKDDLAAEAEGFPDLEKTLRAARKIATCTRPLEKLTAPFPTAER